MSAIVFQSSRVVCQPIRIDTGSADQDGRLIMVDGLLVGILVRLEGEEQAPFQGYWSIEAGFGPLESAKPEPFRDLEAARAWVGRMVNSV